MKDGDIKALIDFVTSASAQTNDAFSIPGDYRLISTERYRNTPDRIRGAFATQDLWEI